jgi:hypothetical protein
VTIWYLTNFSRLELERSAINELAEQGWLRDSIWSIYDGHITVECTIVIDDQTFPIRLVYPNQFPQVPAWVIPRDKGAYWSRHQYGSGGSLCLELRPDNWVQSATGADVLKSAYKLLKSEKSNLIKETEEIPSAENISDIQSYNWHNSPLLIHAETEKRLLNGTANGITAFRWDVMGKSWPILVSDNEIQLKLPLPEFEESRAWGMKIPAVKLVGERPNIEIKARSDFDQHYKIGIDDEKFREVPFIVILVSKDGLTAYHCPSDGNVYERNIITLRNDQGVRANKSKVDSQYKIAIVGVGSIGSKVSESLARSGFKNFLLIDGDVFLPGNIERHVLDWRDVGFKKVDRMRQKLTQISGNINVQTIESNLNWQQSAKNYGSYIDALTSCDLIIDATGDAGTSLLLGALAYENASSFISTEVFEGGIGAVVARSIPKIDPPYVQGRAAFLAFCEQMETPPPKSGVDPYQSFNDDGLPLVADDAAVSFAASFTTLVALDVIEENFEAHAASWQLLGLRKAWIFDHLGHTISLDVGTWQELQQESLSESTSEFLKNLIEKIDEDNYPS